MAADRIENVAFGLAAVVHFFRAAASLFTFAPAGVTLYFPFAPATAHEMKPAQLPARRARRSKLLRAAQALSKIRLLCRYAHFLSGVSASGARVWCPVCKALDSTTQK